MQIVKKYKKVSIDDIINFNIFRVLMCSSNNIATNELTQRVQNRVLKNDKF